MGLSGRSVFDIREPFALVICEKPAAAQRIAHALGASGLKKMSGFARGDNKAAEDMGLPIFCATDKKGQHFVVCYALGHLYGLVDAGGNRSIYPALDVKWMPLSKKNSGTNNTLLSEKIRKIIKAISALSKKASIFIHACDYDQEGEVIGYNILEYACNKKYHKSLRAKFSNLTDDEIIHSFDNLLKPIAPLADAGKSRHMIDFIYGVNLSRALTQSLKSNDDGDGGVYYNLTIGRVQGPTLAFVVDKEIEITRHIPVPYWTVEGKFEKDKHMIYAHYCPPKLDSLHKATLVVNDCKNQDGEIAEVKIQKVAIKPPHPFSIGDLQKEAYRVFKFSPSFTLSVAEKLYLSALISYPRTSSQKLPASINYSKIVSNLSNLAFPSYFTYNNDENDNSHSNYNSYAEMARRLLSKENLSPNEGSKSDPAHPAIYPTGQKPKGKLEDAQFKLFDLIAKRFFATFGDPSLTLQTVITILVKGAHIFKAEEKKFLYEGWMYFYKPYVNNTGAEMPYVISMLHEGDILKNVDVTITDKLTQPPARFNQSSLLEKMEKEKIGTKSTRSEIINTLFKRNYITNAVDPSKDKETSDPHRGMTGIRPTDIGFSVVQSMRKYVPNIVSVDLTRNMDAQLEKIEAGEIKSDLVINHSINKLMDALVIFKENQREIGSQITSAIKTTNTSLPSTRRIQTVLGICPACKRGNLVVKKSNKTKKRFAGCSLYSSDKCSVVAPLPQKGTIKGTGKICTACGWPVIQSRYSNRERYPWQFCVNMACPSKVCNGNNLGNKPSEQL
jgi:DNA topoisomerase-1